MATTEALTPWAGLTQAGATVAGEAELLRPERLDGCQGPGGRHKVVPSVVCSMCCLFGIVYCFFGESSRVLDTQLSAEASVGVGLGVGVLCGLVTMLVRSVGLFMVGLTLGLLVAVAALVGLEELSASPPRSVWVPLGVLLGLGTLFAVLTLQWQRLFTTLSTACFGAAVIAVALDYFAELLGLVLYVYERLKATPRSEPVCWVTWAVLGGWAALAMLGVLVQWKVTAEGYSHTKVPAAWERSKKTRRKQAGGAGPGGGAQAKGAGPEPAYRRKPNPVRRYDGDVLSPSYIQNFRERQVEVDLCSDDPQPSVIGPHLAPPLVNGPLSTRPMSSGPLSTRPMSSGPLSTRPMSSGPLSTRPMSSGPLSMRPMSSGPLSTRPMSSSGPHNAPLLSGVLHNSRPISSGGAHNSRPVSSSSPHNAPLLSSGPHNSRPISSGGPHNSRPISSGGAHNSRPISSGGPHNSRPISSGGAHNSRPISSGGPHNSRPVSSSGSNAAPLSGGPHNSRPPSGVGPPPFARPPSGSSAHAVVDLGYDYGGPAAAPLAEAVGPLLRI
ncbi:hypothetical protein CRUP_015220 [Coryphaenoides rupestris]|nr:hypothetical protein CRUP_015220 [Coryphaenoides rupestris]